MKPYLHIYSGLGSGPSRGDGGGGGWGLSTTNHLVDFLEKE